MKVNEFRLKLYPNDFAKIRRFYAEKMSFKIIYEWNREESKGAMFDVGGTTLELLWPRPEGIGDASSGSTLSLAVDDVWKLAEELDGEVEFVHGIRDNPWGDTSVAVRDPEGYEISLFTQTKEYDD